MLLAMTRRFEPKPIGVELDDGTTQNIMLDISYFESRSSNESFSLFLCERNSYCYNENDRSETIEILTTSQTFLWEPICGQSEDDVFDKLLIDVQKLLPNIRAEDYMKYEVVKTFDIDRTQFETDGPIRQRIEILKNLSSLDYTTRSYRLESLMLQPTFPVNDDFSLVSVNVFVLDEGSSLNEMHDTDLDQLIERLTESITHELTTL